MCERCSTAGNPWEPCPITELAHRLAETARARYALTLQQTCVIAFMLEDRSVGYAAPLLGISPRTVRYHRQQIFRITRTRSALQLALQLSTGIHNSD